MATTTMNPAATAQNSAVSVHWHPGMSNCAVCDYPATRTVQKGNGSTTNVCDNHLRCGTQITDGDHHTYMAHPNAYNVILDQR